MVDRRGLLAGAAVLALSGCGKTGDDPGGAPPSLSATSVEGDIELLQAAYQQEIHDASVYQALKNEPFAKIEEAHADRIAEALDKLGATPDPPPSDFDPTGADPQAIEGNAIAFYLDMLPKVYDAKLRTVIASILAVEAEQLAVLRDEDGASALTDAFVYGFKS